MVRSARALTFTALLLAVSMLAVFEFRGPGGRGHVDVRQPAADAAAREVRVHADAGVARPPAAVERAPERRRIGIVCQPARTGADEPSRRARSAAEGLDAAEELRRRRLLREDRRRGAQVPRPRSERPDVDGERDARVCWARRRPARRPRRRSRRARRSSPPSNRRARPGPDSAPTSCRSTRAASTGCTGTRNTPTCAWSSRRNSRSRSSAAIRTTSPIRATTSTWRCSASTRTTSRWRAATI